MTASDAVPSPEIRLVMRPLSEVARQFAQTRLAITNPAAQQVVEDLCDALDVALAEVKRVRDLLAHARLVSPSPSMTVYVGDVEAALDGTGERVRGIRGGNGG